MTTAAYSSTPAMGADAPLPYPPTRQDTAVVDTYHGAQVADPYRWLEDDNSAETKAWVQAQNAVTIQYLNQIPSRARYKDQLEKLWNYERYGLPYRRGSRYFYTRNSGLQNQSVLYVADSLQGEPRVLIDPNTLSTDGTVSLTLTTPNDAGTLLVYGTSTGGSDWQEFRVKDIATGQDLPDVLRWIKFSGVSWAKDGSGFYYSRFPEPKEGAALTERNRDQQVFFHKLGDPQSADRLIYARPDQPDWGFGAYVTDDGTYLILSIRVGTDPRTRVYYRDLRQPEAQSPIVPLLDDFDAAYDFIGNVGAKFYFQTDLDAERQRVIRIDLARPERASWQEIIPQGADTLQSVSLLGGQLVTQYLQDARSAVRAYDLEGKLLRQVALPGIGTVYGFGGRQADEETFYLYTSFTAPPTIYRYEVASGQSTVYREPQIDFDASRYETKQVFIPSKDGTRVPAFIVHRKGLTLDGSHPCLLYGYGGFQVSLTPSFSVARTVWLDQGGIYVQACLRGGGEYGTAWHEAGTKLRKQNVFDDFIATAEWLIQEKYTQSAKLAIKGGSNGGLLVGACMAQRPDLFGACLPGVGVMDMLRYHLFTIGWAWESDYGTSADEAEFRALYAYSPLHRLRSGVRYPATLVTTADHDDRVVPAHSFKFAAQLQACQDADGPPVLIRIETSAGHGAGTALSKVIDQTADEYAFLTRVLGMEE